MSLLATCSPRFHSPKKTVLDHRLQRRLIVRDHVFASVGDDKLPRLNKLLDVLLRDRRERESGRRDDQRSISPKPPLREPEDLAKRQVSRIDADDSGESPSEFDRMFDVSSFFRIDISAAVSIFSIKSGSFRIFSTRLIARFSASSVVAR